MQCKKLNVKLNFLQSNVWWLELRYSVVTSLQCAVEYSKRVHVHCSGRIIFRYANLSIYFKKIYCLDYQQVEWLKSFTVSQQVDIEDMGSYHRADKLDSSFQ